jgi:hypothetical protein
VGDYVLPYETLVKNVKITIKIIDIIKNSRRYCYFLYIYINALL